MKGSKKRRLIEIISIEKGMDKCVKVNSFATLGMQNKILQSQLCWDIPNEKIECHTFTFLDWEILWTLNAALDRKRVKFKTITHIFKATVVVDAKETQFAICFVSKQGLYFLRLILAVKVILNTEAAA